MYVIHRLDICFAPMNFPVDHVVLFTEFCEVGIAQTQLVNAVAMVGKLVDEFVWCVAQISSPCCFLMTFNIIAPKKVARIDMSQIQEVIL